MVTAAERLAEINRLANKLKSQVSTADLDSFSKEELGSLIKSTQQATEGVKQATQTVKSRLSSGQTKEQIRAIDDSKSLVQTAATKAKSLPTTPTSPSFSLPSSQPKDRVSSTVALSSALNKAVEVARKQRQSAELDFIGGRIPPGAISASTFGSLMSGLNRASTQFTQPIISETLAAVEADRKVIEDQQNDIRDLALSLAQNGASQEAVQGLLNLPDIDSAIAASAGIMQSIAKEGQVVEKVGSTLVTYDPADPQGTMQVLYSSSTGGSTGEKTTSGTTSSPGSNIDFLSAKTADVKSQAKQVFAQDFANRLITELTDEQLRLFMNDFIEAQNSAGQSLDPTQYYNEWRNAIGLETEEETEEGISNPWKG